MSLALATLLPGLILVALGAPLALGSAGFAAALRALPRSRAAAVATFTAASVWFLWQVWDLSPADFGDYRLPLFAGFALLAALSFRFVAEFLAVRGLAALVLLAAWPLLHAAYMEFQYPQRLCLVGAVYFGIVLAIWLGAQPWRLRDFLEWLYARPGRARGCGALLAAYGLLLCAVACTY
jgi:hypothetical protein